MSLVVCAETPAELIDPNEPELLPYPTFNEEEQRIEIWVHPAPVIGRHNVAATAGSLFGFLIQFLDRDEVSGVLLGERA